MATTIHPFIRTSTCHIFQLHRFPSSPITRHFYVLSLIFVHLHLAVGTRYFFIKKGGAQLQECRYIPGEWKSDDEAELKVQLFASAILRSFLQGAVMERILRLTMSTKDSLITENDKCFSRLDCLTISGCTHPPRCLLCHRPSFIVSSLYCIELVYMKLPIAEVSLFMVAIL